MSDLSAHLSLCNQQRSAWFGWHCKADAVGSFLISRIVTTAFVAIIAAFAVAHFVK